MGIKTRRKAGHCSPLLLGRVPIRVDGQDAALTGEAVSKCEIGFNHPNRLALQRRCGFAFPYPHGNDHDQSQNHDEYPGWEGGFGDHCRLVHQGVDADGEKQVSRNQINDRKDQSPDEQERKIQGEACQCVAPKNKIGNMGEDEQDQHGKYGPDPSISFILCFDLEIKLAQVKAAIFHLFGEGIAQELSDQPSQDGCHAAFAPDGIEMDIAVDPVDEQDDRLGGDP